MDGKEGRTVRKDGLHGKGFGLDCNGSCIESPFNMIESLQERSAITNFSLPVQVSLTTKDIFERASCQLVM